MVNHRHQVIDGDEKFFPADVLVWPHNRVSISGTHMARYYSGPVAPKENASSSGWNVVSGLLCCFVIWRLFISDGWDEVWQSKFRYASKYGISQDKITKARKPHDCDWMKAPIGDKDCHFEIRVHTDRAAFDQYGKRIVLFDDGVTWLPADNINRPYPLVPHEGVDTVTAVTLTWEKIEGD